MGASASTRIDGNTTLKDNSRWMADLPISLQNVSLTEIAIPGSHDSFTFNMIKSNGICKATLPSFLRRFSNSSLLHYFVYNWSVTQSLDAADQLKCGIRYFDIRLAAKPKNEAYELPVYVHGLYCEAILSYLEVVKQFLQNHKKEIVILDFNHFYDMSLESHLNLTDKVLKLFGIMLCPVQQHHQLLSMQWMWENNYQVILIYHYELQTHHKFLWTSSCIRSNWPDKRSCKEIMKFLDSEWERERDYPARFKVYQGVLTPDLLFIFKRLLSNLKKSLVYIGIFEIFSNWIRNRKPHRNSSHSDNILLTEHQANIFLADFVEFGGFIESVLSLNTEVKIG